MVLLALPYIRPRVRYNRHAFVRHFARHCSREYRLKIISSRLGNCATLVRAMSYVKKESRIKIGIKNDLTVVRNLRKDSIIYLIDL